MMAAALAAGLMDFDLTQGNRVIIQLQNIPQYLVSLHAIWELGATAVTLNPTFKSNLFAPENYCLKVQVISHIPPVPPVHPKGPLTHMPI